MLNFTRIANCSYSTSSGEALVIFHDFIFFLAILLGIKFCHIVFLIFSFYKIIINSVMLSWADLPVECLVKNLLKCFAYFSFLLLSIKFFMYSGYKYFARYFISWYFPPVCALSFHSLTLSLHIKSFQFW